MLQLEDEEGLLIRKIRREAICGASHVTTSCPPEMERLLLKISEEATAAAARRKQSE